MLKAYQRKTKFFEFSPDTSGGGLKFKKWCHFEMASSQWFLYNDWVPMVFASCIFLCLQTLLPSCLTRNYTEKIVALAVRALL